jgi:hypothetical protein
VEAVEAVEAVDRSLDALLWGGGMAFSVTDPVTAGEVHA